MNRTNATGTEILLKLNGTFLIVFGVFGALADIASYLRSVGPFGGIFYNDPSVISSFEAHTLAIIVGTLLYNPNRPYNNREMITYGFFTELILGSSNLIWFDIFNDRDKIILGVISTSIHWLFVVCYVYIYVKLYFKSDRDKR